MSATNVPLNYTFEVFYDSVTGSYKFTGYDNTLNPTITLARGGVYNFVINDPSNQFYIQTDPGVNGLNPKLTNIISRDVLGVANNGQDVGTVTFTVPTLIAQSSWTSMPVGAVVDYATKLSYQALQGSKVSELNSVLGGFDGNSTSIDLSKLIFINNEYIDDAYWVNTARVDNGLLCLL